MTSSARETATKAYAAQMDTLRLMFDDARAYWKARDAEGKPGIPRHDRDVKWDAMSRAIKGEIPVFFHAATLGQIKAALEFVDEQKLSNVVIVSSGDVWRVADELARRKIAVIVAGTFDPPMRQDAPYDERFAVPGKLAKAGVRFCIADDGEADAAMLARNLPYHAAVAVAFGLSRDEALRAVTLYPAQILGVADQLGSIEPGKIADLVVADGDPLEVTTHVEQVYIRGQAISMETRHTRLFHKYDGKPRGPKARPR
jgi:imidazolonepropionase-like amidohydrolase